MINYYKIYEGDNLVGEGTASKIAEIIGCNSGQVSTACSNKNLLKKKYRVEFVKKVRPPESLYDVWDHEDKLLMTGTSREIKEKFNLGLKSSITYYIASNIKLRGKYIISYHDEIKPEDKHFNEILWHLKLYGNTVTKRNPDKYLNRLREHNIEVNIKKRKDYINKNHRGRPDVYYILEKL